MWNFVFNYNKNDLLYQKAYKNLHECKTFKQFFISQIVFELHAVKNSFWFSTQSLLRHFGPIGNFFGSNVLYAFQLNRKPSTSHMGATKRNNFGPRPICTGGNGVTKFVLRVKIHPQCEFHAFIYSCLQNIFMKCNFGLPCGQWLRLRLISKTPVA
jgi:hypothetical protein